MERNSCLWLEGGKGGREEEVKKQGRVKEEEEEGKGEELSAFMPGVWT